MPIPFHLLYEKQVVAEHSRRYRQTTWHNHLIPEDVYHASGYINDWNRHRLERIIRNNKTNNKSLLLGDYGIDFISHDAERDTYHAGQAKCYEKSRVTAGDCITFTNTVAFQMHTTGYLYTSRDRLEPYLRENIAASRGLLVHEVMPFVDTRQQDIHATEATHVLRPYQREAIRSVLESESPKTLLRLITGSGKTLVASHILRTINHRRIVCVAPLRCSVDQLRARVSKFLPDHVGLLVDTDGCTDTRFLRNELNKLNGDGRAWVVYTTFASFVDVVPTLMSGTDMANAFLLIDEVHNAVNNQGVCTNANLFGRSLYLSATVPEELSCSLEFDEVFSYSIRTAINDGVCVDYEVYVPYIPGYTCSTPDTSEDDSRPVADLRSKAMYLATGILRTGKRRCIVYLGNIADSVAFEEEIVSVFRDYHGITVDTFQMNCNTPVRERDRILTDFSGPNADAYGRIKLIANVRILNEAIDIVPCDSVFITKVGDTTNDITTVQRLGRALRKDPNNITKTAALFMWCDDYHESVRSLQFLKQEDAEFHSKIRVINKDYDNTTTDRELVGKVVNEYTRFLTVKCLTMAEAWELRRQHWVDQYSRKGNVTPSQKSKDPDEKRAGQWQHTMRQNYKAGKLTTERVAELESMPGWAWDSDNFSANLKHWMDQYSRKGNATPSMKSKDPGEKRAGQWQSKVRQNYKAGKLTTDRVAELESMPGWAWETTDPFSANLKHWMDQYSRKGNVNPSKISKDPGEKRAGQWQNKMRQNYKAGKLTTDRVAELESMPGWAWDSDNFSANLKHWADQYSRKGNANPSQKSKDPDEKRAGHWQNKMRQNYKAGKLTTDRVAELESMPGWAWRSR